MLENQVVTSPVRVDPVRPAASAPQAPLITIAYSVRVSEGAQTCLGVKDMCRRPNRERVRPHGLLNWVNVGRAFPADATWIARGDSLTRIPRLARARTASFDRRRMEKRRGSPFG